MVTHPSTSSSSRMRVIYHNWSAMKQRPHPQSVANPSTNRVWRSATTLIEANVLPLSTSKHRRRRLWHATHHCVAPYVDIILHRGRFWAKSAASGSVRWCCIRSCWMVLSHVMRGRPSCLLQSAGAEANRILLASALSSMRIICPNKVSRQWVWVASSASVHHHSVQIGTTWCQAACADTTGRVHRSYVRPS